MGAVLKANLESDVYVDFIQKYRFILDFKIPKSTEVLINSNRYVRNKIVFLLT